MSVFRLAALAIVLALFPATGADASGATFWTGPYGSTVYAAPSLNAPVLARLPENLPVHVTQAANTWGRTLLWNAIPGWIQLASSVTSQPPSPAPLSYQPSVLRPIGPHAPMALSAGGHTREIVYLRAQPSFGAAKVGLLKNLSPLRVDAWATDQGGSAWYHAIGVGASGWVYGDAVTLDTGNAATQPRVLAPLHGKGMWFTYALLENSPAATIVAAARAAGLSHVYVEVGSSNRGFYGADGLARLLPLAHHAGIRVIAWVYPYLEDLPRDVSLSVAAARYVAPSGDRPDGLVADVEEVMAEGTVRAYGQVLRALLGPAQLMAIAAFPPQSVPGRTYPFATAALSWNAIVPMDYWHLRRRAYSAAEAYRYVSDSVRLIRQQTGAGEPVEVLGQMFDIFDSGVNYPSASEIEGCAQAAADAGALGVSFFEFNHATQEEWGALAALKPDFK